MTAPRRSAVTERPWASTACGFSPTARSARPRGVRARTKAVTATVSEGEVGERGLGEGAGERQGREGLDARRRGDAGEREAVGVGGGGGGEERDAEADDVLGEAEGDGEDAVQQAEGHAGEERGGDAGPEREAEVDGEPAGEGADDHDALDAEVEDACPLADELAHGGEDQRRGDAEDGGPEAGGGEDVEVLHGSGSGRRARTAKGNGLVMLGYFRTFGKVEAWEAYFSQEDGRGEARVVHQPLRMRKRVSLRAATMVRSAVARRMSAM